MTYFANYYAPENQIYPTNPAKRAIVDRLLQFDLNVLYRSLSEFLIPIVREKKLLSNLNSVKGKKVTEALSYLESILTNNEYVAGEHLTLADFSIYYGIKFASEFGYVFSKFIHICKWFHHLKQEIASIDQYMNYTMIRTIYPSNSASFDGDKETIINDNSYDQIGTCNLDKLCVEDRENGKVTVDCESGDCNMVTSFIKKKIEDESSQNFFDNMLKNTEENMFDRSQ